MQKKKTTQKPVYVTHNTVQSCYNIVCLIQNDHEMYPSAYPRGKGMHAFP